MNAFKHWISLCWFRLSIISCLKINNEKVYCDYYDEQNLVRYNITQNFIGDHLLSLVQQLLQSIQKKTKTLMTEVVNPTKEKTHKRNIQSKSLLPCWFIVSHVDFPVGRKQTILY